MNDKDENNQNNVHIEQITPDKKISSEEKEAIIKFTDNDEILSKTQQFKIINSKKGNDELELPKRKVGLTETIKIKISDLRAKIAEENMELPSLKKKKSLYDTVIIKLDDLINNRKALKTYSSKKVIGIEEPYVENKFHILKPKDITKKKNIKINVYSEEFGRQLYNLNKIALDNLSAQKVRNVRKQSVAMRIGRIEKIKISEKNYLHYQAKLNKFAINKLYYKFAPKETKKYKLYKYGVILSSFMLFVTSAIIVNWFVQGIKINNLSNAIVEETPIEEVIDEGVVFNIEPVPEDENTEVNEEEIQRNSLYWKYLNTPLSSVDFTELIKQNSDTVAWIIINNTNINYPIVQTTDNDYYLSRDFNRNRNQAGWVFADFRDNFNNFNNNMILYGHGRKDGVMFGSLNDTLKPKWYTNPDNQIIQLSTIKYNTMWQIFSIYKIQAESYYITTDFTSDASYQTFINTMKNRSIYDFGVDVNTNDKILTLSTCYNNNGIRIVVQAKLVKIQER